MSAVGRVERLAATAFASQTALFLVLPLLVIVPMSFGDARYLAMPHGALSTQNYARLLDDPAWLLSLRDSLAVALPAAAIATVWSVAFSIGLWRRTGRAIGVLRVLALGPLIVPGIVHAVAYHRALSYVGLFDTYTGAILVHAVKGLPFAVLAVSVSLASVDRASIDIARSLGASERQALTRVLLPQLRAGVATGFLFAFVTSWDEIVVTLFITGRNVHTLPKQIWEGLFLNVDPAVAALGSLTIVATLIAVIALGEVARRQNHPRKSANETRRP